MSRATVGLTPTRQVPASTVATLELSSKPVSELWRDLFDHQNIRDSFIHAVREFSTGKTVSELYDALEDLSIPYWIRSRIRDVGLGNRRGAWRLANDIVPNLGHGLSSVEDIMATAALFEPDAERPPLAVVVDREFETFERRKRVKICKLLSILSRAFDIRFVASGVTRAFVRCEHREDLPGVSEWRVTPTDGGLLSDVVDEAMVDLDPDGRAVQVLRKIADEPSEALAYSELYALFSELDDSRVRQCVNRLDANAEDGLGLVATFGPRSSRKVELLEPGRRVLDAFDAEIGRQSRLGDVVSETGKPYPQCRVNPRSGDGGEDGPRPYRVGWMSRNNHAAATACSRNNDVTLVKSRLQGGDGRTHEVSYDPDRDEAVMAVEATEPLPYVVSTAVALATPWFVDEVLSPERLERIDEPPQILRDARCIGALSDEALDDPAVLRDELVEWGQRIQDFTVDLRNGEYDDRNSFRSEIMRSAHGLSGSIAHLLDVIGVDLVRELRVPDGADLENLENLATSIGIATAIQSRYNGVFNCYRQLFETRDEKRSTSFTAEVDASSPTGSLIGSLVIRGKDVHRLRPALEARLESPRDVHEDAPEFAVRLSIGETSRSTIANVANRILLPKRIKPTSEMVTLSHALVPDPYAVARALENLGAEDRPRDIRVGELRYAFASLESASVLPDCPSSVSSVVSTLLATEAPLSQRDLADRADVSTRSIRNHRGRLEALGLVRIDAAGYRLTLSFRDERGADRGDSATAEAVGEAPDDVHDDDQSEPSTLEDLDEDDARTCTSTDDEDLEVWTRLAARLTATSSPGAESSVSMGPSLEQTALQAAV